MLAQRGFPTLYANTTDGGLVVKISGIRACAQCKRFRLPEGMSASMPDLCAECFPEPSGSQPP